MWSRLGAFALIWSIAGSAFGQTERDHEVERLEAINSLWLLKLRPSVALVLPGDGAAEGTGGIGFAVAGLEKRGTTWEALRLDRMQAWTYGTLDLAFTLFDIREQMIGTDVDHDLCFAALPVVALGDCQYGGIVGLRAQLLHHAHATANRRWFHRWFELGAVFNFVGDSFDVDFVNTRLPITLAVSLDQVANVPLPDGEASLRLRGLLDVSFVHRFAGYRHELTAGVTYRPALAPFEPVDDFALELRARLAYVWLAALAGSIRSTPQRVFLELRTVTWRKPWLADEIVFGENTYFIQLGLELTFRNLTPS